jgi:hypothetical protein
VSHARTEQNLDKDLARTSGIAKFKIFLQSELVAEWEGTLPAAGGFTRELCLRIPPE